MTDYFVLLNEVRRPWIELESLRTRFLAQSAQVHPDRVHEKTDLEKEQATHASAEFNAAYNCLRETKPRLLHLLELERGAKPQDIEELPGATLDIGFAVAALCRQVDLFAVESARITSPLLRVGAFERAQKWLGQLRDLQHGVHLLQSDWDRELEAMNAAWNRAPREKAGRTAALPLDRLEELYRLYSYTSRWLAQIQDRIVQLTW